MNRSAVLAALSAVLLWGCATTDQRVLDLGDETQLQRRSYQSRIFDTTDREKVMRAAITTLQDLGFIIHEQDFLGHTHLFTTKGHKGHKGNS